MSVTDAPNANGHKDADCNCARWEQLHKPDKITSQLFLIFSRGAQCVNKTASVKASGMAAVGYKDNVISIAAAKPLGLAHAQKMSKAKFNYPMLECS